MYGPIAEFTALLKSSARGHDNTGIVEGKLRPQHSTSFVEKAIFLEKESHTYQMLCDTGGAETST